jgi:preprotein translocase subunit SecY
MSAAESIANNPELRRRIGFTLFILAMYRIGVHVPVPGVNSAVIGEFFSSQGNSFFGIFNLFSGGALERFSIFALGIMPYISSSIIIQLLTSVVPYLEALQKEGDQGRKKLNQFTRYGTVLLAVIQGFGISTFLLNSNFEQKSFVVAANVGFVPFKIMTIMTLTAGTMLIMWLGEQITERGIGNGASLIIFSGIAAGIPAGALSTWELVKQGQLNFALALGLVVFMVGVIAVVIFLEVGQRRIPVQYSQRGAGRTPMGAQTSHLPLKLNFSGVIPPIFASSLLMFPNLVFQFFPSLQTTAIQAALSPTGVIHNLLYVGLIVFFTFFYVQIQFKPNEVADNLKKYGGFIPGIRAGKPTADFLQRVLDRISVGGAVYLSIICVLPTLLVSQLNVSFFFGGTSLIILVGVALDTAQQIQSHMITQKYEGFMRGAKIRSRRVRI